MSSKRSRTDHACPSTTAKVKYDAKKFTSKEAFKSYKDAIDKKKAWVAERGFDLDMHHPYPRLMSIIEQRGWQRLCAQPQPAVVSIVREFYANAIDRKNLQVMVRGVPVTYSASAINRYYGLPDIPNGEFNASESNLDPNAIIQAIGISGARWRTTENALSHKLESKYMDYELKAWHHFVGAKLFPTKHFGTVDVAYGNLLYAIVTNKSIDVGKIIHASILKSMASTQYGFYHPSLITDLCKKAGVRWNDNEEVLNPMHIIDRNTIQRFDKPTATSSAQPDNVPNVPVQPHTGRSRSLTDRVAAMETELYRARIDMRAYHDEMVAHNQGMMELASYQDLCFRMQQTHLGADMSAFPLAPMWLPPYPPAVPVQPSHTQEYGDADEAGGTEEFNYAEDDTFSRN